LVASLRAQGGEFNGKAGFSILGRATRRAPFRRPIFLAATVGWWIKGVLGFLRFLDPSSSEVKTVGPAAARPDRIDLDKLMLLSSPIYGANRRVFQQCCPCARRWKPKDANANGLTAPSGKRCSRAARNTNQSYQSMAFCMPPASARCDADESCGFHRISATCARETACPPWSRLLKE